MAERTRDELLESIRNGRCKPSPVRRVEIPKDNGGVRKLGIPTVIDRITIFQNIKVFIQCWLGYYGIADMKNEIDAWNEWLRRRIRMYIWKQWKLPRTRVTNLRNLGMPDWMAYRNGNTRKGYWVVAGSGILKTTITNERLARLSEAYKSLHYL